ncbi:hypothetical protein MCOR27_011105 [Pyricularia oryzae]|uniref:Uncharacterized protein n=1 Tax=Pyricularia grisea TaxID=148305 RepID=A0ABQ8NTL3_PYRGI|nr:hypothetical protein MCOR01_000948 [Pyricularia oryzae]KAI6300591.1 hypothetical protein MCOR33_003748 [Pyricularia grisea]KAH9427241.1 hypothetical protein MCOR02_012365 [Pyricularia oryzae]KAI6257268.1 hypothetical protein MCOR19_006330 [Pyricularia oryzae]KAI6266242.1 hypothetical protein MCOR27_011105 [Pyricularia oryzae]
MEHNSRSLDDRQNYPDRDSIQCYSERDRFRLAYVDSDCSDAESDASGINQSSLRSYHSLFRMGSSYRDPVQRRSPFRLPQDMDPTQAVYEGWTVYVPRDEKDSYNVRVAPTSHSQQELAEMHLAALDQYHGAHRSSIGCLPMRRILRRATWRPSYDEHIDSRIAKCQKSLQDELSYLLQDRSRHSSSSERERIWTVAMLQEQLCPRFASTKPTPARRHRLRWWKDNARSRETEFFVVILGRETRHEPGGIPLYARYTNPWRAVDDEQTLQEKEALSRERGEDCFAPPQSNRGSRRSFPRPVIRHRDPPAPVPSAPLLSQAPRSDAFSNQPPAESLPPRPWESGLQQDTWFAPHQAPFSLPNLPPPPVPARPRCWHPGPPPTYRATPTPPGPISHSPSMFEGFRQSPPLNHFEAFFPLQRNPPSVSWPPSPSSYRHFSPPLSSYGPPPPQPNAYSNLTTPTSLGSIHVPMFGPLSLVPPVVSRSPSPPYSPRSNENNATRDEKSESTSTSGSAGSNDSHLHRQDTGTTELEPKEEAKSLAKDKPTGMRSDD